MDESKVQELINSFGAIGEIMKLFNQSMRTAGFNEADAREYTKVFESSIIPDINKMGGK